MSTVVEHICFFKVKDDPKADDLAEDIRALKSLDGVAYLDGQLCYNKVFQILGANYTHVLHSRYLHKAALDAYFVHPSHLALNKVLTPYIEDKFVVDWEAVPVGLPIKGGHWAARIAFIKLVDGVTEEETSQVLNLLRDLRDKFPFIRQISAGKNFSSRAKGFHLGFVAMFDNLEELEQLSGIAELDAELRRSSVAPFLSNLVIADVDFKVTKLSGPNSAEFHHSSRAFNCK